MALILVVDDEKDIREALRDVFVNYGHQVLLACHGAEALEILKTKKPKLIIMDVQMPVMDAWDFRRNQKADPILKNIPILIFYAGFKPPGLDANGFLKKPIDISEIMAATAPFLSS